MTGLLSLERQSPRRLRKKFHETIRQEKAMRILETEKTWRLQS